MKKNDIITLTIDGFGMEGEGVAHFDGVTVFIPFSLPGEKVEVKILKVAKSIAFAKIEKIIVASEKRVKPECGVFTKCGGCTLQHLDYEKHGEVKKNKIETCFRKIARLDVVVDDFYPSAPYEYRNKLQLPVRNKDGVAEIGFFRSNSHSVVPTERCPIQAGGAEKIISFFKKFIAENKIPAYDESNGKGVLRHIVVRTFKQSYLVVVVTKSGRISWDKRLIDGLIGCLGENITVVRNINDSDNNVVLGEKNEVLYGDGYLKIEENGLKYKIGVFSFMQVNNEIKEKIYSDVVKFGAVDKDTVVIDGYSGAGVMTAMLAKNAYKAIGIEIVKEAADAARELAEENGIKNMISVCAPCEKALPQIVKEVENDKKVLLVLDPPRKGVDIAVLQAVLDAKPQKIVYVSCSPNTLARDAGVLTGTLKIVDGKIFAADKTEDCKAGGVYEITYIGAYDMFAETANVETLVVLSHKKPDSHLEVKIDFDNTSLDKTAIAERAEKRKPQEKTTYKKIQEWIEENYGFKVHTVYVAEVKRELGLPMYDAPNAVDELKRPRQHPTEQMTTAIKAALKHFEII